MSARLIGSLIVVLLVTALAFVVIRLLVSLATALGHAVGHLFSGGPGTDRGAAQPGTFAAASWQAGTGQAGKCSNQQCRKINVPEARFCARCGRPLAPAESAPNGGATT